MAYFKPITRICGQYGCNRAATRALCNRYNEEINVYCEKHGQASLRELEQSEAREPFREVWPAR